MKLNKTLLDDFRSLKIREKGLEVTIEEREDKDLIDSNLRHPFNLTKISGEI